MHANTSALIMHTHWSCFFVQCSLVLVDCQKPDDHLSIDMGDNPSHQRQPIGQDLELIEIKDPVSSPHKISFSRSGSNNSASLPLKQHGLVKTMRSSKSSDGQRISILSIFTVSVTLVPSAYIYLCTFNQYNYTCK